MTQTIQEQMYAKLYAQVVASSLTQNEAIEVRGVFFMLLAMADKGGNVGGVDAALARIINVPLETFKFAVERLTQPDPTSQSPDYEGRRLMRLDGARGYFIVNYAKYAGIANDVQRREYFRTKQQESRARKATVASLDGGATASEGVGEGQSGSPPLQNAPTGNHPLNLAQVRVVCELEGISEGRYPGLAEEFFNHYEGRAKVGVNGEKVWMAGETIITDWRSILRGWRVRREGKMGEETGGAVIAKTRGGGGLKERDKERAGSPVLTNVTSMNEQGQVSGPGGGI